MKFLRQCPKIIERRTHLSKIKKPCWRQLPISKSLLPKVAETIIALRLTSFTKKGVNPIVENIHMANEKKIILCNNLLFIFSYSSQQIFQFIAWLTRFLIRSPTWIRIKLSHIKLTQSIKLVRGKRRHI